MSSLSGVIEVSAWCDPRTRLERTVAVDIVGDEVADLGPENEVDLFIAGLFTLEGWLMEYALLSFFFSVGRENFVSLMTRTIDTPFACGQHITMLEFLACMYSIIS